LTVIVMIAMTRRYSLISRNGSLRR